MSGVAAGAPVTGRADPGLIERTLTRMFLRPVHVLSATSLSARFRLIDLEGVAFEDAQWSPGQKLQIKVEGGFVTRTYTPIRWDAARGVARIVAFAHGEGPGSEWARGALTGETRQVFGPRRSLDLAQLPASSVLFGDETSFGLAASLQAQGVRAVFEVGSIAESQRVLQALGIEPLALMERRTDDSHLDELFAAMASRAESASAALVLTGKSTSIQQLSRSLKAWGVEARRIKAKAYWAPGKSGLD